MFTVTGTINSVGYRVGVHPEPPEDPQSFGCIMGSDNATAWLTLHEGQDAQATPTSEPVTLDLTKPDTILAFLYGTTNVTAVEGDGVPDVLGLVGTAGVVY
jgi:hypothetical protein